MSTDLLTRVYPVGAELLRRVDAKIEQYGAPGGHAVWRELRLAGTLPGDAAEHFYWLDPDQVRATGDQFRVEADRLAAAVASVPDVAWHGVGGQAYATRWSQLSGCLDGLNERLAALARFAGDLSDWVQSSRDAMAVEIATCLGSREAVILTTGPAHGTAEFGATAAADLGVRILQAARDCAESGWALRQRWAAQLDEVAWRSIDVFGPVPAHEIEVA